MANPINSDNFLPNFTPRMLATTEPAADAAPAADELVDDPGDLVRIGPLDLDDLDHPLGLRERHVDEPQELLEIVQQAELRGDDQHLGVLNLDHAEAAAAASIPPAAPLVMQPASAPVTSAMNSDAAACRSATTK